MAEAQETIGDLIEELNPLREKAEEATYRHLYEKHIRGGEKNAHRDKPASSWNTPLNNEIVRVLKSHNLPSTVPGGSIEEEPERESPRESTPPESSVSSKESPAMSLSLSLIHI